MYAVADATLIRIMCYNNTWTAGAANFVQGLVAGKVKKAPVVFSSREARHDFNSFQAGHRQQRT